MSKSDLLNGKNELNNVFNFITMFNNNYKILYT